MPSRTANVKSQIREEMSQEKVGGLLFILKNDPLGVLIFPELFAFLPEHEKALTRAPLIPVYRVGMGFILTTGIFPLELNTVRSIYRYHLNVPR